MFIPCGDPEGHNEELGPCDLCNVIICGVCNEGTTCGNGCGVRANRKRQRSVNLFDRNENDVFDSLRVIVGRRYYAYLRDIEYEVTDELLMVHLVFECIDGTWFDLLRDDLADMPPWLTLAQTARFRIADIVVVEEFLTRILSSMRSGAIAFHRGGWVQMWIDGQQPVVPWVQAILCLPGLSNNPVLTAASGVLRAGYVTRFERVRPGQGGLQKLRRLESATGA